MVRPGYLGDVAIWAVEKLDLRSEEKLIQYIFVFEGFGSSLSEFTKQVRNFEA